MKQRTAKTSKRRRIQRRPPRAKVARLPLAVRVEIVRRLGDGHSRRTVMLWLNRKAAVRAALKREQSGTAHCRITANNLWNWLASNPPEAAGLPRP